MASGTSALTIAESPWEAPQTAQADWRAGRVVARGDLEQAWWQIGQQVDFDARTVSALRGLE